MAGSFHDVKPAPGAGMDVLHEGEAAVLHGQHDAGRSREPGQHLRGFGQHRLDRFPRAGAGYLGLDGAAIGANAGIPGPVLRVNVGDTVTVALSNSLAPEAPTTTATPVQVVAAPPATNGRTTKQTVKPATPTTSKPVVTPKVVTTTAPSGGEHESEPNDD